jgi:hypothetical protein
MFGTVIDEDVLQNKPEIVKAEGLKTLSVLVQSPQKPSRDEELLSYALYRLWNRIIEVMFFRSSVYGNCT